MPRADLSNHLVHWTSGDDFTEAFGNLVNIVLSRKLIGSGDKIKGNFGCVCFTEAPEAEFHKIKSKYSPFGVQVPKKWLFEKGGRPVIYQTNEEYELLPDNLKWRHVRYEPNGEPPIDFTWEREWRFPEIELFLEDVEFRVLMPSDQWAEELIRVWEHDQEIDERIRALEYGDEYCGYGLGEIPFTYSIIDA